LFGFAVKALGKALECKELEEIGQAGVAEGAARTADFRWKRSASMPRSTRIMLVHEAVEVEGLGEVAGVEGPLGDSPAPMIKRQAPDSWRMLGPMAPS
jgi:hypothetical protein